MLFLQKQIYSTILYKKFNIELFFYDILSMRLYRIFKTLILFYSHLVGCEGVSEQKQMIVPKNNGLSPVINQVKAKPQQVSKRETSITHFGNDLTQQLNEIKNNENLTQQQKKLKIRESVLNFFQQTKTVGK